jgi:hypothetical protein
MNVKSSKVGNNKDAVVPNVGHTDDLENVSGEAPGFEDHEQCIVASMDRSHRTEYGYEPLDARSIRHLILLPSSSPDAELRCLLRPASIDGSSQFEALFYT